MPKLLIIRQFVFLFYSADFFEKRKHIHVELRKGKRRYVAKFWLEPKIELIVRGNLSNSEINQAQQLIVENLDLLINQIEKIMRGEKVKAIKK